MEAEIERSVRAVYERWNAKDLPGVMAAFKSLGPNGFSVEYVGEAPIDGPAAVDEMWKTYGATCTTEVVHLLVNGTEAAAMIHNVIHGDDSQIVLPSIETYKIDDGHLSVRYYHRTPE